MSTIILNDPICGFDALIGQERPIRLLKAALAKNEMPHALLFTGETGIGKTTAAEIVAMTLNCRADHESGRTMAGDEAIRASGPCGQCISCRKILSGNHPDIHRIHPAGAFIRIDQIRELSRIIALKPYEASVRLVLLSETHRMNTEAANALLKALEEPPASTLFILTAARSTDLLPTIVSRCQQIRFNPIPGDMLEAWLAEQFDLDDRNAMIIASLANGSFGRALALKDSDWIMQRDRIIDLMENLCDSSRSIGFYFAESLAQKKDLLAHAFEIMKTWFRDLAVVNRCPDKICNRDLNERIARAASRYTPEQILEKITIIEQCERAIKGNANPRLALDAMVMKLAK